MRFLETFSQDVQFAFRQFRKSPGFAFAAVLTLALGIGANTAMFTVIHSVLLRPLPYPAAEQLVTIGEGKNPQDIHSTSWLNLQDLRKQSKSFEDLAGYIIDVAIVQTSQGGQTVLGPKLTGNLLSLLGARPVLGRIFTEADCAPGAPLTVLLSEGLWRQRFGADPHITGRQIRIGDMPHTVIGVMPASFRFPEEAGADAGKGIWLPSQPSQEMQTGRGFTMYMIVGRLRPGVKIGQARAELSTITQQIKRLDPEHTATLDFALRPYRDTVTSSVRPVFLALTAALGLVLLIACVNVANLQLSRCLARYQELAVRVALGAPKSRLVRQLLVEGGILSALGAFAGLGLAIAILSSLQALPEDMIPRANEIHVRIAVIVALAGFATLATLLSSLIPALFAMNAEPQVALRGSGRGVSQRAAQSRMARWLVMGEVAIAAVLLVACSLLFRTLYNLEHKALGFDIQNLVTFSATPPTSAGYLSGQAYPASARADIATRVYQPLLEKLRSLPGVKDAALASSIPFDGIDMRTSFELNGKKNTTQEEKERRHARIRVMSGEYTTAMRTPMLRGRAISDDDTEDRPYVTVINRAFAREFFPPGADAVGQQLDLGGKETGMVKPYTIVGVMADAAQKRVSEAPTPELILSYRQVPPDSLFYPILLTSATNYVLRTEVRGDMSGAIHGVFSKIAPGFAIDNLRTMQQTVDAANFNQRLGFYLIGSFAGLAVLMVIVGLYGVLSQLVSRRRQEIGVRMALGATTQSILALILRHGALLIAIGLGAGIAAAIAATRLIASFLYGIEPLDFWSYAATAVLLLIVGLLAAAVPARRAAAIEPMQALRTE